MRSSFEPSSLPGPAAGFRPGTLPGRGEGAGGQSGTPTLSPDTERAALREELRAEIEAENRECLLAAVGALGEAAGEWRRIDARELDALSWGTVELGLEIAGRVLRRELDRDPAALVPLVKEALEQLCTPERIRIAISPLDMPLIETGVASELRDLAASCKAEFEVDSTLATGEARVRAGESSVDLRLGGILERFREGLSEVIEGPGKRS